jgi:hypothetical protein
MNFEKELEQAFESVSEDMEAYMHSPRIQDRGSYDLPPFHEYGLSIDKCIDDRGAYIACVLATGGPHYEISFWPNGKVTFFFAWSGSKEIDITDEPWAQWLRGYFKDIGLLDFNFNE